MKKRYEQMKSNKISEKQYNESKNRFNKIILSTMNEIVKLPIYIDDTAGATPEYIKSECRRISRNTGKKIDLIIVDYLQIMDGPGKDSYERTTNISKSIQGIYKEFNCPFLAVAQLSRSVEARSKKEKRPIMSDLRESGQIEQDSSCIMFIYRDYYYNPEESDPLEAEVIVAKNKDGETGILRLDCELDRFKFLDYGQSGRRGR